MGTILFDTDIGDGSGQQISVTLNIDGVTGSPTVPGMLERVFLLDGFGDGDGTPITTGGLTSSSVSSTTDPLDDDTDLMGTNAVRQQTVTSGDGGPIDAVSFAAGIDAGAFDGTAGVFTISANGSGTFHLTYGDVGNDVLDLTVGGTAESLRIVGSSDFPGDRSYLLTVTIIDNGGGTSAVPVDVAPGDGEAPLPFDETIPLDDFSNVDLENVEQIKLDFTDISDPDNPVLETVDILIDFIEVQGRQPTAFPTASMPDPRNMSHESDTSAFSHSYSWATSFGSSDLG